jgi:hypothetical protein
MDESRLTNDTTVKDKSKANRSVVSTSGDSCEVLVNKGGGTEQGSAAAQLTAWICQGSLSSPRTSSTWRM